MAWKTERWFKDLFPGHENVYAEYHRLPTRELVIVAAAVLDAALAELIAKRLRELPKESEQFLGVSGDGRAPAASFGARIQLALLVGLLTVEDAGILRALKNLRNTFAHRAKADFLKEPARGQAQSLLDQWRTLAKKLMGSGVIKGSERTLEELQKYLDVHSEAGEGLVLAVFSTYQSYFHLLESDVTPINLVVPKNA